jgi:hypothetical protein
MLFSLMWSIFCKLIERLWGQRYINGQTKTYLKLPSTNQFLGLNSLTKWDYPKIDELQHFIHHANNMHQLNLPDKFLKSK